MANIHILYNFRTSYIVIRAFLLQVEQNFPFFPQLLQAVIFTLVWRKQMHNDIAEIDYDPACICLPLFFPGHFEFMFGGFKHRVSQAVDHPVTGARTNYEIISKRCNFMNVE